jgi:hypothetical protein
MMTAEPTSTSGRSERGALPTSWVVRGRRWLSLASQDVVAGSSAVASESDRWFLFAFRTLAEGANRTQRGIDTVTGEVAKAIVTQWIRRRPTWLTPRTPRERLERMLRAEAKRRGVDVKQEEFHAFAGKIALLLELVYTGMVPLDAVGFEAGGVPEEDADALRDEPAPRAAAG